MTILSTHILATLITLASPAAVQDSDTQVKGPPKVGGGSTGEDMQVPGKPGDSTTRGNMPGVGYDNQGGMMDSASLEAQALNGGGIQYHTHNHYYGSADGYGTPNYVIPPQNTGTFRGNYGMARGYYGGGYGGGVNYYGGAGAYGRSYNRNYGMSTNAQFRAADASNAVFNPYGNGGGGRMYWSD